MPFLVTQPTATAQSINVAAHKYAGLGHQRINNCKVCTLQMQKTWVYIWASVSEGSYASSANSVQTAKQSNGMLHVKSKHTYFHYIVQPLMIQNITKSIKRIHSLTSACYYMVISRRDNANLKNTLVRLYLFHKSVDSICQWLSFKWRHVSKNNFFANSPWILLTQKY